MISSLLSLGLTLATQDTAEVLQPPAVTTVLFEGKRHEVDGTFPDPNDLWLGPDDLEGVTAWEWKDGALCREESCLLVPPERRDHLVLEIEGRTWLSATELARWQGRTVAFDRVRRTWWFGAPRPPSTERDGRPIAPDFTLPDWRGQPVSLSDYLGTKVLLVTWASW